jgi:hypothetical protein
VLVGVRAKARRAILPDLELAAVLMVTKYRGMASRSRLGEEDEGRHALARLDRVRDFLAHHVTQVDVLNPLGRERRSRLRHCAEQSQEVRPIQSFSGWQIITPIAQRHRRSRQAAAEKLQALPPGDFHGLSPHFKPPQVN